MNFTEQLAAALDGYTIDRAQGRIEQWPVNSNRASEVAWPCPSGPRYLVLLRRHWRDLPAHSGETQLLFEEGHVHEPAVARRLEEDGWTIWKPRKAASWPAYQITGSLDREGCLPAGLAAHLGLNPETVYPLEIKGLEPHSWGRLNSISDMLHAKQPWLRKYPGQLLLYMLLENHAEGLFVIKNKVTARLKYLYMRLEDWLETGEELLRRCEEVNRYMADGAEPPITGYEEAVCSRCSVRSICLPGEAGEGAIPLVEDELEGALARRDELQAAHREFEELDGFVKERAQKATTEDAILVCGDWELAVKTRTKEIKPSPGRTVQYREVRIKRLKGAVSDEPAG